MTGFDKRPHVNPTLKVIVHIDMDMFYAAVEMRDQPSLREKPMAVGTMAMLTTSNYKVLHLISSLRFEAYSVTSNHYLRLANSESEPRCQVSSRRNFARI